MRQLKDMRILITGVNGQVGFEVAHALSSCGAELVFGVRNTGAISGLAFPTIKLDLENPAELSAALKEVKPQILVNPAAYTAVDKAESEKESAFAINSRALEVMAEAMRALKGGMIHFSTDYIYNPADEQPISEDDPKNPPNVYAASKWSGEQALASADCPYICLRTSWVYGINGNNFVKTMLKLGREREHLRIVGDQVGSPTSAVTLGQAVSRILALGSRDPVGFLASHSGSYNLSDQGYTNWHGFALEIFQAARDFGIDLKVAAVDPIKTEEYKTPAARPLNSRMSLHKIKESFDFHPPDWQRALRGFLYQGKINLY